MMSLLNELGKEIKCEVYLGGKPQLYLFSHDGGSGLRLYDSSYVNL